MQRASIKDVQNAVESYRQSLLNNNAALQQQTLSAKAGSVALKGLAMAGNMLASFGISMAINLAVTAIDNYIHRVEIAKQKMEEAKAAYESTEQKIVELKTQIEDINKSMEELEKRKPLDYATDEQYQKLKATNDELQRQLTIQEELARSQNIETEEAAVKSANTTSNSKYKKETAYRGNNAVKVGAQVTETEELGYAIDAYKQYESAANEAETALINLGTRTDENKKEWDKYNKSIEENKNKMENTRSYISKLAESILNARSNITGVTDDGKEMAVVYDEALRSYDNFINGLTIPDIDIQGAIPEKINVEITIKDALEKIESLSSGFGKLNSIMSDIKDGGNFDYGSLVDEDFVNTFGGYTDEYNNFIETISNSPSDIEACQSAFDSLVSTWIASSGVLYDVNEQTAGVIAKSLEEKGIANANEIVQRQLAASREYAALSANTHGNALYGEINALINEDGQIDINEQALIQYAIAKETANGTVLSVDGDIMNLIALVEALGGATDSLQNFALMRAHLDDMISRGGAAKEAAENLIASDIYKKQQQKSLNDVKSVINKTTTTNTNFRGIKGNSTSTASGGSGGVSYSKQAEFINWFDLFIQDKEERLEQLNKKSEDINKEYERAIKTGDEQSIASLKEELTKISYEIQSLYASSANELRAQMQTNEYALPLLYKIAPELKDVDIEDWTPTLIEKIKTNLGDTENANIFNELVTTIQKAFELVGSENGEGDWAQSFANIWEEIDDINKKYYDSRIENTQNILDGYDDEIDKIDDLISGYDDEIDSLETMSELYGESSNNIIDWLDTSQKKLEAYSAKEQKLNEKKLALQQALLENQQMQEDIRNNSVNDLDSVESLDTLSSTEEEYRKALEETDKQLKENQKDLLNYYNDTHSQIVDALKEIHTLQKEEAEEALEENQEQRKNALEEQQEAALKALENERDAAIAAADATSNGLQDELDLLQKRNEELKDTNEYYDKLLNLQKLKRDNTHVVIDEATGKEVYTYDRQAVKEAESELDEWWADKAYNNQVNSLQEQIDKQKDYTDQLEDEYDKRIDNLKEAQEKEKDALDKTLEDEKAAFDAYWNKVLSDEQLNIEARTLEQQFGYQNALAGLTGFLGELNGVIEAQNAELYNKGQALSNSFLSGMFSTIDEGVASYLSQLGINTGSLNLNFTPNINQNDINDIISKMYQNSQGWSIANKNGDEEAKELFANNNQELGALIGAHYDNKSGEWSVDGKNIFNNLDDSTKKSIEATVKNTNSNELISKSNKDIVASAKAVKESILSNSNGINTLTEEAQNVVDMCDKLINAYENSSNSISSPSNQSSSSTNSSSSSSSTGNRTLDPSRTVTSGNVTTEYDTQGRKLRETTINANGTKTIKEYDINGGYTKHTVSDSSSSSSIPTTVPSRDSDFEEYKDNGDGTVTIYYYYASGRLKSLKKVSGYVDSNGKLVKKHTGIESGLVGNLRETDKVAFLKRIAIDGLDTNEVPAILKKGEGVFTDNQMNNIASALKAGEISNKVLKVYDNIFNIPSAKNTSSTIEKGDTFIIQNMSVKTDNAETFMRQLRLKAGRV